LSTATTITIKSFLLETIRKAVPIYTSIVHAFVCSRIDYCNYLLIGFPKTRLSPLQTVLNAAA